MRSWSFHSAGKVVFGSGAVEQLGTLAGELGLGRVLIVTDRALIAAGALEAIQQPLARAGIAVDVFDDGEPEPTVAAADRCLARVRSGQANAAPDGVIALGGGSNMDLAKITAVVLTHGGAVRDYFGENKVPGPVLPVICVPTTAGTGSEVTASAVMTDTENQVKVGIVSQFMRPRLALVDPRLTLSCPRQVTADSGIDALTHAIEAFTAVDNDDFPLPAGQISTYQGRNPLAAALAEKAIALAGEHLVRAVEEPGNLAAREGMALAALLAGLAFSNIGVALVHAMEYPVGGVVHVSHGAGNGLLLPFVMRYNQPLRQAEFARIAELLGEDVRGLSTEAAAGRAIDAVERLKAQIGIPARLRDIGITRDQLRVLAEKAIKIERILRVNPRYPTVDEIEQIYTSAL